MTDIKIELKVDGQEIKRRDKHGFVEDSVDFLKIEFTFSKDWEGLTKTVFVRSRIDEKITYSELLPADSNIYEVPSAIIEAPGFLVSVFGTDGNIELPTEEYRISIRESGVPREAVEPPEDKKSAFAELMNAVEELTTEYPYIHIKYADKIPTDNSDMKDEPADYMGVFAGYSTEPPVDYTEYKWQCVKGADGEKGDKGDKGDKAYKENIIYITESGTWTVPENVKEIDVFIVNGGYDGEDSSATSTSTSSSAAGGAGGACCWVPSYAVTAGQNIDVVVGAANGGVSSFDGLYLVDCDYQGVAGIVKVGAQGVAGGGATTTGVYVTIDGSSRSRNDGNSGQLGYVNNVYCKMPCPIDGKYYGVSGASGGGLRTGAGVSQFLQSGDAGAGGIAGKDNADFCPAGGFGAITKSNSTSKDYWAGGGGGASYDNNGTNGGEPQARASSDSSRVPVGGNGGDATTYGCGGGGAGGGGGTGGAGAQGVVIIAY